MSFTTVIYLLSFQVNVYVATTLICGDYNAFNWPIGARVFVAAVWLIAVINTIANVKVRPTPNTECQCKRVKQPFKPKLIKGGKK